MNKNRSFLTKHSRLPFQIISDLHLEVGQQYSTFSVPPSAPYLVLAGDIGRLMDYEAYLSFLAKDIHAYKKIFLILGNHEFYGLSYNAALGLATKLEQEPILEGKLVLLHRRRFDVDCDVTVLGCTLWSRIKEDAKEIVKLKVKDFQKIEGWSIDENNAAFVAESAWLKNQIAEIQNEGKERRLLVLTHHAPCLEGTARPEQVGNAWSSAFATDLLTEDRRAQWEGVKVWVFGHTHFSTSFERAEVRVCNQRGYVLPGSQESRESGFDVKKVVRI